MKKIRIELMGWKGIHRVYTIDKPTMLNGPVGSGKSAVLEAIAYALTGRAPHEDPTKGASLDHIAKFFEARGGSVRLYDGEDWIERGVKVDLESHRIQEVVETSDLDKPGPKWRWGVGEAVINIAEFTVMSAEKRRAFILRVCGSPEEMEPAALVREIFYRFLVEVCGEFAAKHLLDGGEEVKDVDDLEPGQRDMVIAWGSHDGAAGIGEDVEATIKAARMKGAVLSDIFPKLLAEARGRSRECGGAAKEAKAAIRELEAEAKGAEAGAAEIDGLKKKIKKARKDLTKLEDQQRDHVEQAGIVASALEQIQGAKGDIADVESRIKMMPKPGKEPAEYTAVDPHDRHTERESLANQLAAMRTALNAIRGEEKTLKRQGAELHDLQARCKRLQETPAAEVSKCLAAIPPDAHHGIPALRTAVGRLTHAWAAESDAAGAMVDDMKKKTETTEGRLTAMRGEAPSGNDMTEAESMVVSADKEIAELVSTERAKEKKARAAHARWKENTDERKRLREWLDLLEKKRDEVINTHAESPEPPDDCADEIAKTKKMISKDTDRLIEAERMAGALDAYRNSSMNAERALVREQAWKRAIKAIESSREEILTDAVAGFMGDIDDAITSFGRKPYHELTNLRGKPAFDIGWYDAERESRVSLSSMSGGQAATFCVALQLAIARRSEGRRFILFEADGVGDWLPTLMSMLRAASDDVEAIVMASNVKTKKTPGWKIIDVAKEDA